MPIQISTTVNSEEIDIKLRSLEERFGMSSDRFATNPLARSIPEDVMIEWDFLIMQRAALLETVANVPLRFSPRFRSTLKIQEAQDIYEGVAA